MNERPKVLLLIPHLGGGGAERVIALIAAGLSRAKYDLHLALVTEARAPADPFPPGLTLHLLGVSRVRSAGPRLLRLVRRLRPQLIVSGIFHLNFLVLLLRPLFPASTRVVVRQNATVSASLAFDRLPFYTRLLYRLLYRRADRVICQSWAMAEDLAGELGIPLSRLAVLPNPLDVEAIQDAARPSPELRPHSNPWPGLGPHLLAVGRLSPEKGFDLLLQALALVREQIPSANLLIAGKGPEETALKALCSRLDLDPAVRFAGQVEKPHALFPGASAFVLSSRHEGMPNALLEAAAGGLPIVALPASAGVTDLLRGQPGAWLAAEISAAALANSLLQALRSLQPGQRFDHPFVSEFRIEPALRAWEDLFDSVLGERES